MGDHRAGSIEPPPHERSYWRCRKCPADHECSEPAWTKSRCWGWTLSECQHQVLKHLQNSGKHKDMTTEDQTYFSDNADYLYVDKSRPGKVEYRVVHDGRGTTPLEEESGNQWSTPQQAEDGTGVSSIEPHQPDTPPSARLGERENRAIATATPKRQPRISDGDHVFLTVATVDTVLDTIERARTGVAHAISLLESGAQAFQQEKKNLDAIAETISSIKRRRR